MRLPAMLPGRRNVAMLEGFAAIIDVARVVREEKNEQRRGRFT